MNYQLQNEVSKANFDIGKRIHNWPPLMKVVYNHSKFSARHESNTTSDVTRPFWPRQDGRQFYAQLVNFEQLKKQFSLTVREKKFTVFPSKLKTLLISKNLT